MKCPRCDAQLEGRSQAGVTAATCSRCAGVWLRIGDLERALRLCAADEGVALKTLALVEGPARTTALRCPECASTLQLITLRSVEVEKCITCRGVFLDPGEGQLIVQRVLAASAQWDPAYQDLLRTVRDRWVTAPLSVDIWEAGGGLDGNPLT